MATISTVNRMNIHGVNPAALGSILLRGNMIDLSRDDLRINASSFELSNMSKHLRTMAKTIPPAIRCAKHMAPGFYKAAAEFYKFAMKLSMAAQRLSVATRRLSSQCLEVTWATREFSKGISISILVCLRISNMGRSVASLSWGRKLPLEPPKKSFTCFMKLPPELRFMIWEAAAETVFSFETSSLWTVCKESFRFMEKTRNKGRNIHLELRTPTLPVDLQYESLATFRHRTNAPTMRARPQQGMHFLAAGAALHHVMVKGHAAMNAMKYLLEVKPKLVDSFGTSGIRTFDQLCRTIEALFDDE